jgi:hypothetical protein
MFPNNCKASGSIPGNNTGFVDAMAVEYVSLQIFKFSFLINPQLFQTHLSPTLDISYKQGQ